MTLPHPKLKGTTLTEFGKEFRRTTLTEFGKEFRQRMHDEQDVDQRAFRDLDIPVFRTVPYSVPLGRRYVYDNRTPQIKMSDYNYVPVLKQLTQDSILIEWDIAYTKEALETFIEYCKDQPQIVHVAPYKLYPISTALEKPVWVHRTYEPMWWVNRYDPYCQLFGFGFVYLPLDAVHAFLETKPEKADDARFSKWYWETYKTATPIHWNVEIIHLHW